MHWCQLNVDLAVETAATQTKPAFAGFKTIDFSLVRAGGLGFYSCEFIRSCLKLTPMVGDAHPPTDILKMMRLFLDKS